MASAKELVTLWDKSGRPRSVEGIAQVLRDSSLDEQQIKQVFDSVNIPYTIPTEYPDDVPAQEEPQAPAQEAIPVPVGFTMKTKTGAELGWKGAQWTNKGKIVPKKYKEQIDAQAQKVLRQQMAQKQKDEENAQRAKDAEYEFEDEPAQETPKAASTEKTEDMRRLQGIAQQINSSPYKERIMELLKSSDPLAQTAIGILLKGDVENVLASLKAKK